MAQTTEQNTPIEWTLDDLLEYLTLAPFRYEIDAALREMERYISTGELPLIVDHHFDGKLQSYEIYPFAFHTKYTLVFDYVSQLVQIVRRGPRGEAYQGGSWVGDSGRLNKQHALRIWPPPAAQATPDHQPRRLTKPSEKPNETLETRIISLMKDIELEKSGLLPREVRTKVRDKYRGRDKPSDTTINRAYKTYTSDKQKPRIISKRTISTIW